MSDSPKSQKPVQDGIDNRRYTRLNVSLITRIKGRRVNPKVMQKIEEGITNISMQGAFIECRDPFPLDTIVAFSFCLPNSPKEIDVNGVVRWCNDSREPFGMGIEFISFVQSDRNNLRNFFKNHISASIENVPELVKWLVDGDPLLSKAAHSALVEISAGSVNYGKDGQRWLNWYRANYPKAGNTGDAE
ncbi:PilZ domain-containing protein [Planctomycetota bacterium]